MLNDIEIKDKIARQVNKFIEVQLRNPGPEKIAAALREDFPKDKISRQWVNAQRKAPGWAFIIWLEKRYRLNIDWVLHGEENDKIPMQKL